MHWCRVFKSICQRLFSLVKGKQQNLSWQLLFSCIVWNLWLHRNDAIFNGAAPNLQSCFSFVLLSFSLWLRLDANSSDFAGENVHNSCDANGSEERRSWIQLYFPFAPIFFLPLFQNLKSVFAFLLSFFLSFPARTSVS